MLFERVLSAALSTQKGRLLFKGSGLFPTSLSDAKAEDTQKHLSDFLYSPVKNLTHTTNTITVTTHTHTHTSRSKIPVPVPGLRGPGIYTS